MKFEEWVRESRRWERRIHVRLRVRSLIPQAPSPYPLPIFPSLSVASAKRLIRSLPAFIRDFPHRGVPPSRPRNETSTPLFCGLPRSPRSPPLRLSKRAPVPLPSLPRSAHKLPSVRPCAARPSVPIAPAPPHVLPQLSFVRRSRPSVRPSPARSLARYCRRAEWLPVSVQAHCSPIS